MSKKSDLPHSSRHVNIYDEDWVFLEQFFGRHSPGRIGVAEAIRKIVHKRVVGLQAQMQQEMDVRQRASAGFANNAMKEEVND